MAVEELMKADPPLTQEAWRRLQGWYKATVDLHIYFRDRKCFSNKCWGGYPAVQFCPLCRYPLERSSSGWWGGG